MYYFCAIAQNAEGIAFGEILTFSPGAIAPDVTTLPASDITESAGALVGSANPNALPTGGYFRFGTEDSGSCSDAFGVRVPASGEAALGSGTSAMGFDELVEGLDPNATYFYCAAAANLGGASFGEVLSFTTEAAPPMVTTVSALADALGVAALVGEADPRGSETVAWFRYSNTDPKECSDDFGTRVPQADGTALGAGREAVSFSESVAGLAPGSYWVCAIAENEGGKAFGNLLVVVIDEDAPESEAESGCGCRVAGGEPERIPLGGLAALAVLALLIRRRRTTAPTRRAA
jgi:MYXO-CTERM domain-containing protein